MEIILSALATNTSLPSQNKDGITSNNISLFMNLIDTSMQKESIHKHVENNTYADFSANMPISETSLDTQASDLLYNIMFKTDEKTEPEENKLQSYENEIDLVVENLSIISAMPQALPLQTNPILSPNYNFAQEGQALIKLDEKPSYFVEAALTEAKLGLNNTGKSPLIQEQQNLLPDSELKVDKEFNRYLNDQAHKNLGSSLNNKQESFTSQAAPNADNSIIQNSSLNNNSKLNEASITDDSPINENVLNSTPNSVNISENPTTIALTSVNENNKAIQLSSQANEENIEQNKLAIEELKSKNLGEQNPNFKEKINFDDKKNDSIENTDTKEKFNFNEKEIEIQRDSQEITDINVNSSLTSKEDVSKASSIKESAKIETSSVTDQVKMNILKAKNSLDNEINFELYPASLGKVNIKIESIGEKTLIHIQVEKPEALFILQQDSKSLEAKLNEAGVKIDNSQLSFNLSNNSNHNNQNHKLFEQYSFKQKASETTETALDTQIYSKPKQDLVDQLDIVI